MTAVVAIDRPSPNADTRPPGGMIDMLVLHYTGMRTAAAALDRLCDPSAGVSAHYVVDEGGAVYQLVDETLRAWHAGVAFWRGATDINARSVGVEIVNPGHEFGYRPFPEAQMTAVVALCRAIVGRHPIPARNVVGHSDVAPARKSDPGELFDWARLAAAGIGVWPGDSDRCPLDADSVRAMLRTIGYDTTELSLAVRAFQRHFRPARVDGRIDVETARRLCGWLEACGE